MMTQRYFDLRDPVNQVATVGRHGRVPPPATPILRDEVDNMFFRHPVTQIRRQQHRRISIYLSGRPKSDSLLDEVNVFTAFEDQVHIQWIGDRSPQMSEVLNSNILHEVRAQESLENGRWEGTIDNADVLEKNTFDMATVRVLAVSRQRDLQVKQLALSLLNSDVFQHHVADGCSVPIVNTEDSAGLPCFGLNMDDVDIKEPDVVDFITSSLESDFEGVTRIHIPKGSALHENILDISIHQALGTGPCFDHHAIVRAFRKAIKELDVFGAHDIKPISIG